MVESTTWERKIEMPMEGVKMRIKMKAMIEKINRNEKGYGSYKLILRKTMRKVNRMILPVVLVAGVWKHRIWNNGAIGGCRTMDSEKFPRN